MAERQRPGARPGARSTRKGDRPGRSARRSTRVVAEPAVDDRHGVPADNPATAESATDTTATDTDPTDTDTTATAGGSGVTESDGGAPPRRIRPRAARERGRDRTVLGLSTPKAVILAVVVAALALTLAVPLRTYLGQRADADAVAAERIALEQRVADLQVQKDQAADPAYITAQARERLGFVMPGETPYQVQLPGARAYSDIAKDAPPVPPGPWYSTLWSTAVDPRGK